METIRLGRTGLNVTRTSLGALPIQRTPMDEAILILRRAHEAGITFFDTARGYTDSEEKMGRALSGVRHEILIATKSGASTREGILRDLKTSLKALNTDHVDLMQLHNAGKLPDLNDSESPYAGLLQARSEGLIRHLGITCHKYSVAVEAVKSGLFETLQYPFSALSDDKELGLIPLCKEHDVGFIAMKALCGGLLTDIRSAFAFFQQYDNAVPIWGIQRMEELGEFLSLDRHPPRMDDALRAKLDKDRLELGKSFCRGCGYCLPCPAEIPLPLATRMYFLLRRAPVQSFLNEEWLGKMRKIQECQHCGKCAERCPYGLDPQSMLPEMLKDYEEMYGRMIGRSDA